jgi:hypothetical protein
MGEWEHMDSWCNQELSRLQFDEGRRAGAGNEAAKGSDYATRAIRSADLGYDFYQSLQVYIMLQRLR